MAIPPKCKQCNGIGFVVKDGAGYRPFTTRIAKSKLYVSGKIKKLRCPFCRGTGHKI